MSCIGTVQFVAQSHDRLLHEAYYTMQAEWGFVYNGSLLLSGVDEDGGFTTDVLEIGDIWYFPKGKSMRWARRASPNIPKVLRTTSRVWTTKTSTCSPLMMATLRKSGKLPQSSHDL